MRVGKLFPPDSQGAEKSCEDMASTAVSPWMSDTDGTSRERRWALLAADGRHVWLGRHSDPSAEELARVTETLAAQGITGWLSIVQGVYFDPAHDLTVIMVRPLNGEGKFDEAVRRFNEARRQELAELGENGRTG